MNDIKNRIFSYLMLLLISVNIYGQNETYSEVYKKIEQEFPLITPVYDNDRNVILYIATKWNYNLNPAVFDKLGNVVIPSGKYGEYSDIDFWNNDISTPGYFVIHVKGGLCGICDLSGNEILKPIYEGIPVLIEGTLNDGYFIITTRDEKTDKLVARLINSNGNTIIPKGKYTTFLHRDSIAKAKGIWVVVNKVGDVFLNGVVDNKGKEIIPCKYSLVMEYEDAFVVRDFNSKYGLFDYNGKMLASVEYDNIGKQSDDLFKCQVGNLWGYLDTKGKLVIPYLYETASDFSDGVAQVSKGGVTQLINNPLKKAPIIEQNRIASVDVDNNIPITGRHNDNMFAFIIGNENYSHLKGADYSINDAKIFKEYCLKTLGVSEKNIRYYEDATYGNMVSAIQRMKDIADVYEGDAQILVYYSGLGIADSKAKGNYLLPVDASIETVTATGYNVEELLNDINSMDVKMSLVIIDAPFSGNDKIGNPLTSDRGVKLSAKTNIAKGNTIICVSDGEGGMAYADKKYGHGLFTYATLKHLQQTKGNCTLKELSDYAIDWVKKESLDMRNIIQTPTVTMSNKIMVNWDNIKL